MIYQIGKYFERYSEVMEEKNYKKGFICGFFDILHEGHIDILNKAKNMCDYLIVGVGTDEFMVKRKTHESVLSYDERVEIVKAIRYVDEVVPEENLDKIGAYYKYGFNVMFAGSDHIGEDVYLDAEKKLKSLGVDTIYIQRTHTVSSTMLRKRAAEICKNMEDYFNV